MKELESSKMLVQHKTSDSLNRGYMYTTKVHIPCCLHTNLKKVLDVVKAECYFFIFLNFYRN